jgi:hypothetical protein
VESPPLAAGVYDVRVPGGSVVLAVNASRELLPRRATVVAGAVGGAPPARPTPPLRDLGWPYVIVVGLLCGEWALRRRSGMR